MVAAAVHGSRIVTLVTDRWQWRGDSPLDRARRVAGTYRMELERLAPEVCAKLDAWARANGQGWVAPDPEPLDLEAVITVTAAADLCHVKPRTIHTWHERGLPWSGRRGREVLVRVRDLVEYEAARRRSRAARGSS